MADMVSDAISLSSYSIPPQPGVDSAAPRGYPTEAAGGETGKTQTGNRCFEAAIREIGLAANATGANNGRPATSINSFISFLSPSSSCKAMLYRIT